jgi:hypothetical protein
MCETSGSGIGLYLTGHFKPGVGPTNPRLEWVHDRWPLVSYSRGELDIKIQYIVEDGVVYQRYSITNRGIAPTPVEFGVDMLIRIAGDELFRGDEGSDGVAVLPDDMVDNHVTFPGPLDLSLVILRELPVLDETPDKKGSAQVVLTIFKNGQRQGLTLDKSLSNNNSHFAPGHVAPNETLDITAAYKLQVVEEEDACLTDFVIPYVDVSAFLDKDRDGHWLLEKSRSNWIYRRHLEHVLSVCVTPTDLGEDNGLGTSPNPRVALMTGEVTWPDISTAGSFSAFRYLVAMYDFVGRPGIAEPALAEKLRSRIYLACRGHIFWTFQTTVQVLGEAWAMFYTPCGYPDGYGIKHTYFLAGKRFFQPQYLIC